MAAHQDSSPTEVTRRLKREQDLSQLLKYIPVRAVIWILLVALIALVGIVGDGLISRVSALETWRKEQGSKLEEVGKDVVEIKTNMQWVKQALEKSK